MVAALVAVSLALGLAACGGSGTTEPNTTEPNTTDTTDTSGTPETTQPTQAAEAADPEPVSDPKVLAVPADYPTIQAAVDATRPGDMVLISPGEYNEAVVARTPFITIRGLDRNTVILDGNDELDNGILAAANGIAIENLTARRYIVNGILFTKAYDADNPETAPPLRGYRASYVTAYNNQQYGIYAFFAQDGLIEHSYTSGHPDSGIYIGQCKPCNAVVDNVTAELNALGYSGTNASGNLFIINSVWRRNRIGMTPNSQNLERLAPQGDIVIAGNLVMDNDAPESPATPEGAFGYGIAIGGGNSNQVVRNRVMNNSNVGIAVTDLNDFLPSNNKIDGNVVQNNGTDLAYYLNSKPDVPAAGNCFTNNEFASSSPIDIETVLACTSVAPDATHPSEATKFRVVPAPDVDYRTVPAPGEQPNMVDPATSKAVPARNLPPKVNLASILVPEVPKEDS
jgi:hypothetical protein